MGLSRFGFTLVKKASLIAGLCLCCWPLIALATSEPSTDKQLKEVQQELKKRQAEVKARQQEQKKAQAELRQAELNLAQQARTLHQTEQEIAGNRTAQGELQTQQNQLDERHQQQQSVLAAQLESHFMTGSSDYLKMLLNKKDPAQMERTLSYFEYLNQARVEAIDALRATKLQLQQVAAQLLEKQHQLEQLLVLQTSQQSTLQQQQREHQHLISRLGAQLKSDLDDIELLQESEQQLKSLMDQTARSGGTVRLKGLDKGLPWPTSGRISHHFNSIRKGQIRWKGVLMSAQTGADIKAIANARVLFADWVKGMGLVMVLDHGSGYISIYGHAQTLLRQAGDEVRSGDTIALVGQSGGQSEPGLYFEIRHQGAPLNPSHWCRE